MVTKKKFGLENERVKGLQREADIQMNRDS